MNRSFKVWNKKKKKEKKTNLKTISFKLKTYKI